jgi:epsilon-lactone hydrolase
MKVSTKARMILWLMRHRHWFQGQWKQKPMGWEKEDVLAFRETCEQGAQRFGKPPHGIRVKKINFGTIPAEWLIPDGAPNDKMIFYVHGGGYVSGSCNDHRTIVSKIAQKAGLTTLLYEYRVAPEHPFPAALDDSILVYQKVLEEGYQSENILVMGESAGGGLALALLLALRDQNIPLPKAAVAITPWTDLTCSGESYNTKNRLSLAPHDSWNIFSHYYVANEDPKNPYISPLFGDLSGLPPLFINAGESDELFDDGRMFALKAKESGVDCTFRSGPGMVHCYPLLAPMFREATEAMDEIIFFIRKQLLQQPH